MKPFLKVSGIIVAALIGTAGPAWADVGIPSRWAATPPVIDGIASPGEWNSAVRTPLAHGEMRTMNDGAYLYVGLDVIDDTVNDPPPPPIIGTGDYYIMAFDVDMNRAVTPNVDLAYASCQDARQFVKAYYLGGNAFTGCQTPSAASLGMDGFGPTPNLATNHRFWEFRLDLSEIGVNPATWSTSSGEIPKVRLNVATASTHPFFETAQPDPNLYPDMTGNLYSLALATMPEFPTGSTGPIFAGVGLVPSTYIDGLGYANINIANYYSATAAPFGGNLNIFGNWNDLYNNFGARSYRVMYSKNGGPLTALQQTWTNFRFNTITMEWVPTAIGPDLINGRYPIPPPSQNWYLTNLLISWQSGQFGDGTYALSLELFDGSGNPISIATGNNLTLFVDNTAPVPVINQVLYYDGSALSNVCACAISTQGTNSSTGYDFDISVTDAHGALGSFSLYGIFGNNQGTGTIYSDSYGNHVNENGPEKWNGVSNIIRPDDPGTFPIEVWRALNQCAYSFILSAQSRIQNGYGLIFPYVDYHVSLTILLGSDPVGSAGSCVLSAQVSPEPLRTLQGSHAMTSSGDGSSTAKTAGH